MEANACHLTAFVVSELMSKKCDSYSFVQLSNLHSYYLHLLPSSSFFLGVDRVCLKAVDCRVMSSQVEEKERTRTHCVLPGETAQPILSDLAELFREFNMDDPKKV
jgi:hypothetical protein